jgi:hypothetical protein
MPAKLPAAFIGVKHARMRDLQISEKAVATSNSLVVNADNECFLNPNRPVFTGDYALNRISATPLLVERREDGYHVTIYGTDERWMPGEVPADYYPGREYYAG